MSNNYMGREFLLEIYDTSVYKILGGIKTRTFNRDNPVADATNSATTGNETESMYTGFSTVTVEGSGIMDSRASSTVYGYKAFSTIANSSNPQATLRLSDSIESYSGVFNITSFKKNAETNGLVEFSASFQNAGVINFA